MKLYTYLNCGANFEQAVRFTKLRGKFAMSLMIIHQHPLPHSA
jgi:hypothetical protein